MKRSLAVILGALAVVLHGTSACNRDVVVGARSLHGATTDAARESGIDVRGTCESVKCDAHHLYQCGNCIDDDSDGLVDMDDPDCLGPCQNREDSLSGAIPGQNHPACEQDCYFDQDSGSGNDGCTWTHACDPLAVPPSYDPEGLQCAYPTDTAAQSACAALAVQSAQCSDVCGPLTPNGCDCFGCCTVPGVPTPVWVGSADALDNPTCDMAHVLDPTRCRPCTQVQSCLNTCERCELCVGKTTLPADCPVTNGCQAPQCDKGTACSPCLPPCPGGQSCITGCCVAPPADADR